MFHHNLLAGLLESLADPVMPTMAGIICPGYAIVNNLTENSMALASRDIRT